MRRQRALCQRAAAAPALHASASDLPVRARAHPYLSDGLATQFRPACAAHARPVVARVAFRVDVLHRCHSDQCGCACVVAPAQLGWWKRSRKLSYGPRPPSINGKARAGTSRLHDEWRRSVGSGLLCQHALVTGQPTVSQVAQGYSPIQWNISNSQRPQETS